MTRRRPIREHVRDVLPFLAALAVCALVGAAVAQADDPKVVKIADPATYNSACGDAYNAVRFYRKAYNEHRTTLGYSLAPKLEQAMSCKRTRERANYWILAADVNRKAADRLLAKRNQIPTGETELRAYINDDCLEEIIDRETADTWSVTIYNYAGSGAYGLPQALPGHKMASAGADWQTNPVTQIRWMRGYVNSRYGGSCNALAHHNSQGWY